MPIFDGLRNGYSTYFMYQPSKGINPQLLQYAGRGSGYGRSMPSTGRSSSSSANKKLDVPGGPYLQRLQYQDNQEAADREVYSARMAALKAVQENDYSDPLDIPQVQEYARKKQQYDTFMGRQAMNANWLEESAEIYSNTRNQLANSGLGGRAFVGNLSNLYLGTGQQMFGGYGSDVAGWRWQRDEKGELTGEKELVNPFTIVQGKNGETDIKFNRYDPEKNPEGAEGIFHNQEFMDWQDRNLPMDNRGNVQKPVTPTTYEVGQLDAFLKSQLTLAVGSGISTDSFVDYDANTGTFYMEKGKEGDYILDRESNEENLRSFVYGAFNAVESQNLKNEALSDYAASAESGGQIVVIKNGKPKYQDVDKSTMSEYLTARARGLVSQGMTRKSAEISERPGADLGGTGGKDTRTLDGWSVIANPRVLMEQSELTGGVIDQDYYLFGGSNMPESFSPGEDTQETWNSYFVNVDAEFRKDLDSNYSFPYPVKAKGDATFSRGLITKANTIVDPDELEDEMYFLSHTSSVGYEPVYTSINGKLSYNLDKQTKVNQTTKQPEQYARMGHTVEGSFAISGRDLLKHVDLPIVDQDGQKKLVKRELKEAKRDVPDDVRDMQKQIDRNNKTIKAFDKDLAEVNKSLSAENPLWVGANTKRKEKLEKLRQEWIDKNKALENRINASYTPEYEDTETDVLLTSDARRRELLKEGLYGQTIQQVVQDDKGNFQVVKGSGKIEDDAYYAIDLRWYMDNSKFIEVASSKENFDALRANILMQTGEFDYMKRDFSITDYIQREAMRTLNTPQNNNE